VLEASQQFQVVSASGKEGEWPLSIGDVTLTGDALSFTLDTEADGKMVSEHYQGKVSGDAIAGTVRPAGNPKAAAVAWKALRDPKTAVSIAK
jgi:hypothetical protein